MELTQQQKKRMGHSHKFTSPQEALAYIEAGRGKLTIRSPRTGCRFTYKIGRKEDSPLFVRVLHDGDNEGEYLYLGFVNGSGRLAAGRKGRGDAPSFKAFDWTVRTLRKGEFNGVEVWHEGTCGKCGRTLTVPESIERGLGPVCAGKA